MKYVPNLLFFASACLVLSLLSPHTVWRPAPLPEPDIPPHTVGLDSSQASSSQPKVPLMEFPLMLPSAELLRTRKGYFAALRGIRNIDSGDGKVDFLVGHEPNAVWNLREYDTILRVYRSMSATLGADRVFRKEIVAYHLLPQHFAYAFHAEVLLESGGPYLMMASPVRSVNIAPEYNSKKFWGTWMINLVVDRRCKVVQVASFLLPTQRADESDWMLEQWDGVLPAVMDACANRSGAAIVPAGLSRHRENFYCVNEIMAFGDIGFHFQCFGRLWARYHTAELRSYVTVILAQPSPEMQIARNLYTNLIVKHLPEISIYWLPTNQLVMVPSLVVPSQGPREASSAGSFVLRVLQPRVSAYFRGKNFTPPRRVALVSTGYSVTNRSFRPSEKFNDLLRRHGFMIFPSNQPHDERMFVASNADMIVTSQGSSSTMLPFLSPGRLPPMLTLCHSGYFAETPFFVGRACHGARYCLSWRPNILVAVPGDDLDAFTESDMNYFFAHTSSSKEAPQRRRKRG